jgi:hypothetical protein
MITTISQSLMKAYQKYLIKAECGLRLKALYIDNTHRSVPSDAMQLGKWFEYCATGSTGRDGTPEPERTVKGQLTADYARAEMQANYFKVFCKGLGIEILHVNKHVQLEHLTGTLDIVAKWNDRTVTIDLKYSGLMDNKWDEMGWEIETLADKDHHMVQARHYTAISGTPFYFWVWHPKQEMVNKLIEVKIDPESIEKHKEQAQNMINALNMDIALGLKARPELMRCAKCELFESCDKKALLPEVETVWHSI